MKWFDDWKLGTKLLLSFMITTAVVVYVGYKGLSTIQWLKGQQEKLYEGQLLPNVALANAQKALLKTRIMDVKSVMPSSKEERMQIQKATQELEKEFFAALERYNGHGLSDEEKSDYAKVQSAWKKYGEVRNEVTKLVAQGKSVAAMRVINSEGNLS